MHLFNLIHIRHQQSSNTHSAASGWLRIKGEQGSDLRGSNDQVDTGNPRVRPVRWERMLPVCTNNQHGMVLWVIEYYNTPSVCAQVHLQPNVLQTTTNEF